MPCGGLWSEGETAWRLQAVNLSDALEVVRVNVDFFDKTNGYANPELFDQIA